MRSPSRSPARTLPVSRRFLQPNIPGFSSQSRPRPRPRHALRADPSQGPRATWPSALRRPRCTGPPGPRDREEEKRRPPVAASEREDAGNLEASRDARAPCRAVVDWSVHRTPAPQLERLRRRGSRDGDEGKGRPARPSRGNEDMEGGGSEPEGPSGTPATQAPLPTPGAGPGRSWSRLHERTLLLPSYPSPLPFKRDGGREKTPRA